MTRIFRHSRIWSFAVALLIAAQLGLSFHIFQDKIGDLTRGDDCALCQVASSMSAAPTAAALPLPTRFIVIRRTTFAVLAPRQAETTASFQSRAPPLPVSA